MVDKIRAIDNMTKIKLWLALTTVGAVLAYPYEYYDSITIALWFMISVALFTAFSKREDPKAN